LILTLLVDCESNLNSRWDTSRFVKPPSIDELKIRLKNAPLKVKTKSICELQKHL
jgi:hypothetical protein